VVEGLANETRQPVVDSIRGFHEVPIPAGVFQKDEGNSS